MARHAEIVKPQTDFTLLIDGKLRDSRTSLEVINPATEKVFALCPAASFTDLNTAVAAAHRALEAWSTKSYAERADLIKQLAMQLRERKNILATLLTQEQGKPLAQSVAEIDRGAAQSEDIVEIAEPRPTISKSPGTGRAKNALPKILTTTNTVIRNIRTPPTLANQAASRCRNRPKLSRSSISVIDYFCS